MLIQIIEFLAVISAAGFGILLARGKEMDFVGIYTVALATALGGGTLRDVLLKRTVFWIDQPYYPILIFVLTILGMTAGKFILDAELKKFLQVPDALGLGLFAIVGAAYAWESLEMPGMILGSKMFVCTLFGVITGCFGGVIAEVICNEVPSLFRKTPLYATCAFVGCWVYLLLAQIPVLASSAPVIGAIFIIAIRLIALRFDWTLPLASPAPPPTKKKQSKAPAKKKSTAKKKSPSRKRAKKS
ncbi:MAG: putative membrane protein YeiH [Verrucomicrobiales bacterium]|jgi:uncharacterized membrane protein YeiH